MAVNGQHMKVTITMTRSNISIGFDYGMPSNMPVNEPPAESNKL